ncbi:MAG: mannitol-1-phosphate 5-dehydrogenase [Chloroflexi bacterium]|nr:mannitol-1-phosphate 5-dehydrogenase [Chloroflexota bacterium]
MNQAIMFGAGNIGRGFLGQLFSESGYRVTFIDIDEPLISALARQQAYTLRLVTNQETRDLRITPVTGILSGDLASVAQVVSQAQIGATAVGARALPYIAPAVAAGIQARRQAGNQAPLNLIICENLKGAAAHFRALVRERLDADDQSFLDRQVGFVDTVIGRMVPELTPELKAQDRTLVVAEPYKELPVDHNGFIGEIPAIVGMQAHDSFELFTARKLYLHNAGHAVLAYLGYLRGYQLGYEALEDAWIRPILEAALDESMRGIAKVYGADHTWLSAHVSDLLGRFANRILADPVLRLGRDPLRKLAPDDRLVGAARAAETTGQTPLNLAYGIAGGLLFDPPGDERAAELQQLIAHQGVEAALLQVCGIRADEPLGQAILERYQCLLSERREG